MSLKNLDDRVMIGLIRPLVRWSAGWSVHPHRTAYTALMLLTLVPVALEMILMSLAPMAVFQFILVVAMAYHNMYHAPFEAVFTPEQQVRDRIWRWCFLLIDLVLLAMFVVKGGMVGAGLSWLIMSAAIFIRSDWMTMTGYYRNHAQHL